MKIKIPELLKSLTMAIASKQSMSLSYGNGLI